MFVPLPISEIKRKPGVLANLNFCFPIDPFLDEVRQTIEKPHFPQHYRMRKLFFCVCPVCEPMAKNKSAILTYQGWSDENRHEFHCSQNRRNQRNIEGHSGRNMKEFRGFYEIRGNKKHRNEELLFSIRLFVYESAVTWIRGLWWKHWLNCVPLFYLAFSKNPVLGQPANLIENHRVRCRAKGCCGLKWSLFVLPGPIRICVSLLNVYYEISGYVSYWHLCLVLNRPKAISNETFSVLGLPPTPPPHVWF